jgi:hypothetical protein
MMFNVPGCPRRGDRFRRCDAVEVETDFVDVVVLQVVIDGSDVIGDWGHVPCQQHLVKIRSFLHPDTCESRPPVTTRDPNQPSPMRHMSAAHYS